MQLQTQHAAGPDFNTADLFMLLPLERLDSRYAARFLGGPAAA